MPAQYPNNLNEIYGGSSIAAMNATMQQQANAEAQDRLDQQRQTLANQFTEQVNPIKLQQEQAALDTTNAELPGKQAQSRILTTNANIGEATQDSDIQAKISSNRTKMSDDEITQYGNILRGLAGVAGMIDQGAPLPLDMQQAMEQKYPGMLQKLQDPRVRQKIVQGNKLWAEMDQKHQRDKELERMRLDVNQSEGKANRQTQWDIANLRFSTMLELASKKADKAVNDKDFKAASIHWDNIADQLEQQGDPKASAARDRAAYYAKLATTAPVNPSRIDPSAAANTGTIQAPPTPATGAPSVGAPLAQQQVIEIGGRKFTRNPTQ